MSAFAQAVTELVAASSQPHGWDATQAAARAVCGLLPTTNPASINEALARLHAPLHTASIPSAGILALCCGAIVEAGGDPQLIVEAVVDRLPATMTHAQRFVAACRQAAGESYEGDAVADFGDQVREQAIDQANAFYALDPMGLGAIAMLSRSPAIRASVRGRHPELLDQALDLQPFHARAAFLATMLRVLDHAPLLAIHPELRRGYLLEMVGVATNTELFILLADALIGAPAAGLLPGERPDSRAAAACRDQPVVPEAETTIAPFNLWNWPALGPNGALPADGQMAGSEHWIWPEGTPADIHPFEGLRVVLVGPPPFARILQAGRCFRDMPADVRITRTLAAPEVDDWLRRLSSAPRPRIV